jgi:hypothetical protein
MTNGGTVVAESKATQLVAELKKLGVNFSVLAQSGGVMMIGPGAPYTIIPAPHYGETDLNEAINKKLLKKTKWTVSGGGKTWTFESYVLR